VSVYIDPAGIRQIHLGLYATKTTGATTNGSQNLFTVAGGLVVVTALVGIATVAFDGTVTSINLQHTPTGGAAADIAAATVVTSDAIGTIYTVTGVAAEGLSLQTTGGAEAPTVTFGKLWQSGGGLILPAGTLTYKGTAADAGTVAWHLTYVPISSTAAVTAA
jgi:hypothetical protein